MRNPELQGSVQGGRQMTHESDSQRSARTLAVALDTCLGYLVQYSYDDDRDPDHQHRAPHEPHHGRGRVHHLRVRAERQRLGTARHAERRPLQPPSRLQLRPPRLGRGGEGLSAWPPKRSPWRSSTSSACTKSPKYSASADSERISSHDRRVSRSPSPSFAPAASGVAQKSCAGPRRASASSHSPGVTR